MENLLDNLKNLLQKDERLVSEGRLLKNKIIELALKLDKDLIELLLSDKQMKEVFFTQVGKATIFDKDKFVKFVSNKQFLPDSYTSFKNKIGLIDEEGEFISEKKEVVLSWPYKDCVLEGGMTKEDQKQDEIFWNEILAPDQITRLLDPKVFTNAKRIDKDGEHKFNGFRTDEKGDIKDNLIIKGNNLLVLHSLKRRFAGKVKLIYIDPPYNTGNDGFNYNDSFNKSTWLTFMKNRLLIAKDLLSEDGSIFVSIDENMKTYLCLLLIELGYVYFKELIWESGKPFGYKATKTIWPRIHETIYHFCKNRERIFYQPTYTEVVSSAGEKILTGSIIKIETDKIYSMDFIIGARESVNFGTGQKPEKLIKKLLEASTKEGDIVLDFFLGSGTTAAVAHKMKRQYIGIEQMDYFDNITLKRLQNVIKGDNIGITNEINWQGGGDFVYLELMKWNENFVEKIQSTKTKEELKNLWETMKEKAFLSYKVDVKTIDEYAKDFDDLSIEDQKRFLLECLDKNHLYVNYSEIDDEEYGVSEEDKKLNKNFYGK